MLTYQQEFLYTVQEDCKELLDLHWSEIALNQDKIKLNPDWDMYKTLEEEGKLKIFTARDQGTLVGYFVAVVCTNMHYKDHLFASNDILFLRKEYRKGFYGIRLIKFTKACLKDDGVSVLMINTKMHQPFGRLLKWLGFKHIEQVYSVYLGE